MLKDDQQREHYDRIMSSRRPTRWLFSCGYDTRYDPFLLDKRPDLVPEFDSLLREAFPEPAGNLLDVGCGSGIYFPLLAKQAGRVIGIDTSSGMIDAARRLIDKKDLDNVDVRIAGAEQLPFPDESFDAVLAFDVLHHISDITAAMSEVRRVLRPGGRFASIEPNVLNPVVWLAHFIPREERGALLRNYPWNIWRLMKKHIGRPRSRYVSHVTSTGNRFVVSFLQLCEKYLQFWPMRYFSIRMLWTAEKG